MTLIYNTEPANVDLVSVQGDAINMEFFVNELLTATSKKYYANINSAPEEGSPFTMASLHMQVRREDGLLLKDWISGVSPSDIVISAGQFDLFDIDGFIGNGFYNYDLKCDNGSGEFTIMSGLFRVIKKITA